MTDLGHDPDDAIALAYLIEHNKIPDAIVLSPGFPQQVQIARGILLEYNVTWPTVIVAQDKQLCGGYHPGKHQALMITDGEADMSLTHEKFQYFQEQEALIIGPAKNLGNKLRCQKMVFQGGYSPNSICPLDKFEKREAVQSFNPSGSKNNFNQLLESPDIKERFYVGKNVCHGFTKEQLQRQWEPANDKMYQFWTRLKGTKAMHDVLAAQCFLDQEIGIWEQAKPKWIGNKMTTESTTDYTYSLIGIK